MQNKRDLFFGLCGEALLRGARNGFPDLMEASLAARRSARSAPSPVLRSIPVRSIGQLLESGPAEIRLTVQAYEDGMLPPEEAMALLSLLVKAQPRVVLEIGTFKGHTTKAMALNLPQALIHTVDLPPDFTPEPTESMPKSDFHLIAQRKVGREFLGTELAARIKQHYGDTATWDFRQAEGATFFFIDGSHTYEYCRSDSEACFRLCQGKGVFVWHDCDDHHPGVLRFIAEWRALGRDIVRIEGTPLCYWSGL
jgi:hypothetical protein